MNDESLQVYLPKFEEKNVGVGEHQWKRVIQKCYI